MEILVLIWFVILFAPLFLSLYLKIELSEWLAWSSVAFILTFFFVNPILWLFRAILWTIVILVRYSNKDQNNSNDSWKESTEEIWNSEYKEDDSFSENLWNDDENLEKIKKLKEKWVLTQEEFENEKKKILWAYSEKESDNNHDQEPNDTKFREKKFNKNIIWFIFLLLFPVIIYLVDLWQEFDRELSRYSHMQQLQGGMFTNQIDINFDNDSVEMEVEKEDSNDYRNWIDVEEIENNKASFFLRYICKII